MQDHLTADALERLVRRRCHVSLAYGWLLHLLGCESCRNRLVTDFPRVGERFLREVFRIQQPVSMPELGDPEAVDRILAHLKTDGISSFLETRPLPDYLQTLPDQPEARQGWAVRNSRRLRDPAVVEHLLARCQVLWHQDAELSVRIARLAVRIADHLPPEEVHPEILTDLRFEAWGKLGNSLRVLGRYRSALQTLGRARALWNESVGAPSIKARHLRFEADLQLALGYPRLAMALARQTRCREFRGDTGPLESLTTALIITKSLERLGRHCEARRRLESLLAEASFEQVGALGYVSLLNNLAGVLVHQNLSLPAWSLLRRRDSLAPEVGKLARLRMQWTDGRFCESMGEYAAADATYREVLRLSEASALEVDQALVLVDLSRVALRRRHRCATREFAGEAIHRLTQIGRRRLATEVRHMAEGGPLVTPS